MDLQTYFDNAVAAGRKSTLANSDQMTLGEMILKLEPIVAKQKDRIKEGSEEATVRFDFEYLHPKFLDSWRGAYNELALGFEESGDEPTVTEFTQMLKAAIGKTFTGWKGGEFTMSEHTPVWVANPGNSGSTAVIDIVDNDYTIYIITGIREY